MRFCFPILVTLAFCCLDPQLVAQQPGRPESKIQDDMDLLPKVKEQELSVELQEFKKKEDISIFVVTLSEKPKVKVTDLTKFLFKSWEDAPITAFVVTYPGYPDGHYFLAGGTGLASEARPFLSRAIRNAKNASEIERDPAISLMVAAREFGFELKRIIEDLEKVAEDPNYGKVKKREPLTEKFPFLKPVNLGFILLGCLVLAGLFFLIRMLRRRRPIQLPEVEPRLRNGGPYSGGNNIRVSFRRRRS